MVHCTIVDIRSRVLDDKTVILLVNMMRKEEEQFARISPAGVIAALAEIGQWTVFKMHSKLHSLYNRQFPNQSPEH